MFILCFLHSETTKLRYKLTAVKSHLKRLNYSLLTSNRDHYCTGKGHASMFVES